MIGEKLEVNNFVVDVSMENAQSILIDASAEKPVVSFFYSALDPTCVAMKKRLEVLAKEKRGNFILAHVNADELGGIASQLGVRALPTVIVMLQGQPVDGLAGEQSEAALRALLEKFLPPQWQEDVAQAQALLATGLIDDQAKAILLLKAATETDNHSELFIALASACLAAGRLDEAEAALLKVPLQDRQSSWTQIDASLSLKREAGKAPEILALEQAHAAAPDDLILVQQLATALAQEKHHEEALVLLFDVLKKDLNAQEGAVRKTFQDVLSSLGKGDPLAVRFQRQLYALIY